ncbi:hypothetical protein [Streptomyces sp. NPDC048659]|uniref:hypothetical protein n=1 Tax=Streptomyces sp. NPDC048659 TaxID=3155489 RepID=UPI0034181EC6
MDQLWDRVGDVALLLYGLLVASFAWSWRRRVDQRPAWLARLPRWAVRGCVAAYVLLGIGVASSGAYGWTGLPEPWVVDFCRTVGPIVCLLSFWPRPSAPNPAGERGR